MLTSKGQLWKGGTGMVMPFHTYTFANAPQPLIIVIPAQGGPS